MGAPLDMPVIVCVITTSNVVKRSVHERRVNGRTVNITKLTELCRQLTSAAYRHCVKTSLPTTLMGRVKQLVRCVCVACAASWPSQPVAEVTCNLSKFLHTQTSSASCRQRVSISAVHYYYYYYYYYYGAFNAPCVGQKDVADITRAKKMRVLRTLPVQRISA